MRGFEQALHRRLGEVDSRLAVERSKEMAGELFMSLKEASLRAPIFKELFDCAIDKALNRYTNSSSWIDFGPQLLGDLGMHLSNHDNTAIAGRLIAEHAAFNGYSLFLRNEATKTCQIGDVLNAMRAADGDADPVLASAETKRDIAALHAALDARYHPNYLVALFSSNHGPVSLTACVVSGSLTAGLGQDLLTTFACLGLGFTLGA